MLQMKQTLHCFLTPFCLIHQTSVLGHSMGRFPEDFPMFSCSNCKSGTVSSALFPKRTALGVCIFPLGLLEEPRPGVLVLGPMHGSGPGSNSAGEHTSHKRVRDRRRQEQVALWGRCPAGNQSPGVFLTAQAWGQFWARFLLIILYGCRS